MFMLMCMTGCQKHIVEANVREAYIEKLETNQIYKIISVPLKLGRIKY